MKVRISTTYGNITVALDPEKAPLTVENFLDYVRSKHYEGTLFHRVIDDFMIQTGGLDTDQQRTQQPRRHHRHGTHRGPALGQRPVFYQYLR
jgi:cyclophilin family peptidyl-prolyl cis-trans isomerase